MDLDSDNDGCSDEVESLLNSDNDDQFDFRQASVCLIDSDGDGLADVLEGLVAVFSNIYRSGIRNCIIFRFESLDSRIHI